MNQYMTKLFYSFYNSKFDESNINPKQIIEAVIQSCSAKKMFLESLQNSKENICIRVSEAETCNFI